MDYQNNFNREERKMFKGEWACSKCGGKITELPFEPDPNRLSQLLCRDCHRSMRQNFRR
jgi:CxxC-x17-CxxC domain-containing protein